MKILSIYAPRRPDAPLSCTPFPRLAPNRIVSKTTDTGQFRELVASGLVVRLPNPRYCYTSVAADILENGSEQMSQCFALLSVVFMIGFVLLFDRVHIAGCYARFCTNALLNQQEIDQLRSILSACQEG